MALETLRRRLHVSGLTPQITADHLKDRFSSFGHVSDVEDLGLNAVGQHRPFTFLTIETTAAQLQKCALHPPGLSAKAGGLNIMSGSTWRGARLLIAPAKPDYTSRLDKERNPPTAQVIKKAEKQRKRKRLEMGEDVGREAQDMRPVTIRNWDTKKHWIKTVDGRLVRPLAMRPLRPLGSPSGSSSVSSKKRMLLKRARRRVINPTLWNPAHLTESAFPPSSTSGGEVGEEWVYEELGDEGDQEVDEEGKIAIGVWRRGDEEQVVRIRPSALPTLVQNDSDAADFEEATASWERASQAETTSDLFGHRPSGSRLPSPLFPTSRIGVSSDLDATAQADIPNATIQDADFNTPNDDRERSSSPLFASHHPMRTPPSGEDIKDEMEADDVANESSRSSSPFFPSHPASSPSRATSPPPASRNQIPDDIRNLAIAERAQQVSLLSSFLSNLDSGPSSPAGSTSQAVKRKNEWAGFSESDSDSDGADRGQAVEGIPLRLRGGADPTAESSSSEEQDSDESDDSEDSSVSDSDEDEDDSSDASSSRPSPGLAQPSTAPPKAKSGLKDMFAPTSSTAAAGGFSLADLGAEMDIDESMDIALPTAPTAAQETALEPLAMPTSKKALFEVDQSVPLFFPTSLISAAPGLLGGGGKANDPSASYIALWLNPTLGGKAMGEGGEGDGPKAEGFWAQETDAQMREIWTADKYGLTKGWKRRAREGRKQKRRRGGDDDD